MRRKLPAPPWWKRAALDEARAKACDVFVKERLREGSAAYVRAFEELRHGVETLFDRTGDLRRIGEPGWQAALGAVDAARYLLGPPLSADDLKTLVAALTGESTKAHEVERQIARIVGDCLDPLRFPWLKEGRAPTAGERTAAIRWSAGLWAVERERTRKRTEASRRQEEMVCTLLSGVGFREEPRCGRRALSDLDELPRGAFSREAQLGPAKCDVPVRLGDGRLLAIECKVSNSALNSIKRLLREVGGKARAWGSEFGARVLPAAVLAGVYKVEHLVEAQEDYGISLFWQHDLDALRRFLRIAG